MSLRAPCAEGGEESQIELNRPITHNPGSHTPFLLLCQFIALWRAYKIPLKRRRRRRGGKGRERNNSFYSPSGTLLWGEGGGRYGKLTRMDSVCVIRGNDNISSSFVSYTRMGDCCVRKWGVWFWERPRSLRHYGNAYFRGWPFVSRHEKWDCMEMKYNFYLQFLALLHVPFLDIDLFTFLSLLWFKPKDLVTPPNSICSKKVFGDSCTWKKVETGCCTVYACMELGKKGGNKLIVLILRFPASETLWLGSITRLFYSPPSLPFMASRKAKYKIAERKGKHVLCGGGKKRNGINTVIVPSHKESRTFKASQQVASIKASFFCAESGVVCLSREKSLTSSSFPSSPPIPGKRGEKKRRRLTNEEHECWNPRRRFVKSGPHNEREGKGRNKEEIPFFFPLIYCVW